MRLILISTYLLFFFFIAKSQSISVGYGPIYTLTNQRIKMISGRNDFQNTDDQLVLSYEHYLKNNRISFLSLFSYLKGHTWIRFPEGSVIASDGFPILGVGYFGVNVYRIDLGMAIDLFNDKFSYYLKPFISIGGQLSKKDGSEFWADLEPINGPDYIELEPISATTSNTTQVVPSIGFKTGFVLWKRIDVGLTFQGVWGFKPYQTMYFKYAYKGVPQETAIFDAKGTGLFCTINIGYLIKKKK